MDGWPRTREWVRKSIRERNGAFCREPFFWNPTQAYESASNKITSPSSQPASQCRHYCVILSAWRNVNGCQNCHFIPLPWPISDRHVPHKPHLLPLAQKNIYIRYGNYDYILSSLVSGNIFVRTLPWKFAMTTHRRKKIFLETGLDTFDPEFTFIKPRLTKYLNGTIIQYWNQSLGQLIMLVRKTREMVWKI